METTKGAYTMKTAREYLIDLHDDYRNNYLTVAKFAEHNGLDVDDAAKLLHIATVVTLKQHPEA